MYLCTFTYKGLDMDGKMTKLITLKRLSVAILGLENNETKILYNVVCLICEKHEVYRFTV